MRKQSVSRFAVSGLGILLLAINVGCSERAAQMESAVTLKSTFADDFLIGAALNARQFTGRDSAGAALTLQQFNSITPENALKWENIHPQRGEYNFGDADAFVGFGESNDLFVVGHTLVWHNQTPDWVFENTLGEPATRDELLATMRDHIATVVGRYKGRIDGWDVVNEALNEDGTLRDSKWRTIIGDDYLEKAFQFAHEADPDAELYYNDYSLENPEKRDGAVRLVQSLLDKGVTVTAIGSQGHNSLSYPTPEEQEAALEAFAALGVKVAITELDMSVLPAPWRMPTAELTAALEARNIDAMNPYADGLPDSIASAQAEQYAMLFRTYRKHADVISRVTFWGVADGDSWKNGWPIPGRTDYPLLFDRSHQPKAAFDAVIATAK